MGCIKFDAFITYDPNLLVQKDGTPVRSKVALPLYTDKNDYKSNQLLAVATSSVFGVAGVGWTPSL
jgi:hypothetical protein